MFQFPLHRDPRCNPPSCANQFPVFRVSVPFTSGSSLQRVCALNRYRSHRRFSSLYIGILAATVIPCCGYEFPYVSVPFTSGSSLQRFLYLHNILLFVGFSSLYIGILAATPERPNHGRFGILRFSSLYIGILAATNVACYEMRKRVRFQFPLHRDPRCNGTLATITQQSLTFQFPLHRDPRCNLTQERIYDRILGFSSLYIGILAAT